MPNTPSPATSFSAQEQALLEQLGSLQAAPDIWQLPAIGWWLSILLVLLVAVVLHFVKNRHQKRQHLYAYKREALTLFKQLRQQTKHSADINRLLKQVAMQCYGRHHCAALSGEAWLAFLQQQQPTLKASESLNKLVQHQQGSSITELSEETLNYCQQWIQKTPSASKQNGEKYV